MIFNWLRDNHVKKILKVIVIDDGPELSHTDRAIEIALKGLEIEVWDWKKLDLCTEVILKTAPNVRDVSLYSSGNNAVMMGWSSTDGLGKFPNVRCPYCVHS